MPVQSCALLRQYIDTMEDKHFVFLGMNDYTDQSLTSQHNRYDSDTVTHKVCTLLRRCANLMLVQSGFNDTVLLRQYIAHSKKQKHLGIYMTALMTDLTVTHNH